MAGRGEDSAMTASPADAQHSGLNKSSEKPSKLTPKSHKIAVVETPRTRGRSRKESVDESERKPGRPSRRSSKSPVTSQSSVKESPKTPEIESTKTLKTPVKDSTEHHKTTVKDSTKVHIKTGEESTSPKNLEQETRKAAKISSKEDSESPKDELKTVPKISLKIPTVTEDSKKAVSDLEKTVDEEPGRLLMDIKTEGEGQEEKPESTPSKGILKVKIKSRSKTKPKQVDGSREDWIKPFSLGWHREVVRRNVYDETNKNRPADVYYRAPCGKKLRSRVEVQGYLTKNNDPLGIECFTFLKEQIYREPFETVRHAGLGRGNASPAPRALVGAKKRKAEMTPESGAAKKPRHEAAESGGVKRVPENTDLVGVKKARLELAKMDKLEKDKDTKKQLPPPPKLKPAPVPAQSAAPVVTSCTISLLTHSQTPTSVPTPMVKVYPNQSLITQVKVAEKMTKVALSNMAGKSPEVRNMPAGSQASPIVIGSEASTVNTSQKAAVPQQGSDPSVLSALQLASTAKLTSTSVQVPIAPRLSATSLLVSAAPNTVSNTQKLSAAPQLVSAVSATQLVSTNPQLIPQLGSAPKLVLPGNIVAQTLAHAPHQVTPLRPIQVPILPHSLPQPNSTTSSPFTMLSGGSVENLSPRVGSISPLPEPLPGPSPSGDLITLPSKLSTKLDFTKTVCLKIGNVKHIVPPSCFVVTAEGVKALLPHGSLPTASRANLEFELVQSSLGEMQKLEGAHMGAAQKRVLDVAGEMKKGAVREQKCNPALCGLHLLHGGFQALTLIFNQLSLVDWLRASQVCKTWRHAASALSKFHSVTLRDRKVTNWQAAFKHIKSWQTETLDLRGLCGAEDSSTWTQFIAALPRLHSLHHLHLGQCPPHVLHHVPSHSPALTSLTADIVSEHGQLDLHSLARLTDLEELNLSIDSTSIVNQHTLAKLPLLADLSFTGLQCRSSQEFTFLEKLTNLESLEIGNCTSWTETTYQHLCCMERLEILRLEHGSDPQPGCLGRVLARLPMLRDLALIMYEMTQDSATMMNTLNNLQSLSVWPRSAKMGLVNTNTLLCVSGMDFLHSFDWGIVSGSTRTSDAVDCVPLAPCPSLTLLCPPDASNDSDSYLPISELVKNICCCLPQTSIRVFRIPKKYGSATREESANEGPTEKGDVGGGEKAREKDSKGEGNSEDLSKGNKTEVTEEAMDVTGEKMDVEEGSGEKQSDRDVTGDEGGNRGASMEEKREGEDGVTEATQDEKEGVPADGGMKVTEECEDTRNGTSDVTEPMDDSSAGEDTGS